MNVDPFKPIIVVLFVVIALWGIIKSRTGGY